MNSLIKSFFAALLFVSFGCHALTSDKQQPVMIEADSVDLDHKSGISVYRGSVLFVRGSMRLRGDKVTVYVRKNDELDKVYVDGSLAKYRQMQDSGKEVKAESERMEYYADKELLYLYDKATVWQEGDVFKSDTIIYDMVKDKVMAGEKADKSLNLDKSNRVKIIIQPKAE